MSRHKKEYILLNNLGSKHILLMKFGQLYVILQKKKFYEKIPQKLRLEN